MTVKPDPRCIPVLIELSGGRRRHGFHEPGRSLVVWKELDPHREDGPWYWAHAHETEVAFSPTQETQNDD